MIISFEKPSEAMPLWCCARTPENFLDGSAPQAGFATARCAVCRPAYPNSDWNASFHAPGIRQGSKSLFHFGPRTRKVCRGKGVQIQAGVIEAEFCFGVRREQNLKSRGSRRNPSTRPFERGADSVDARDLEADPFAC